MASMECFNNQYFGNSGEREKQVLLNQSLIKVSDFYGFQLVREDYKGKTKISFFNIDALLERNYTLKNILREKTQLGNLLKAQGVKILNWTQEYIQSEKKDKPKLSKFLKEVAIDEAVENLYKLSGEDWNKAEILNLKNSCHHSEQRRIYERCLELFNFLDKRDILKVSKYDTNRYNYYRLALSFLSRADNDPFKTAIYQNFKEDEILSSDEILLRLQKIHKQSHLGGRVHNTSEAAMREFHCYFDYKTLRKSDQKATFKIEGLNPKKIKLRQNKIPFFIDFDDLLSDDNQSTKIKELRIKPLRVTNEEDDELDINDPRMTFAK